MSIYYSKELMEQLRVTVEERDEVMKSLNGVFDPGRFIVVEGIDGAGKSCFCVNLAEAIRERYSTKVIQTAEFTDGFVGEYIHKHFNDEVITDNELQLLALLDRIDHLTKPDGVMEMIQLALNRSTVVCDRGWMSTLAYALSRNDNNINSERIQLLLKLADMVTGITISPDVTIFIDIPPQLAIKRVSVRGKKRERFEDSKTLRYVDIAYRQLITHMKLNKVCTEYTNLTKSFIMINGEMSENAMVDDACMKMEELGLFTSSPLKGE